MHDLFDIVRGCCGIIHMNLLCRWFVEQLPVVRLGRVAVQYSHVPPEPAEWSMRDVWEGVTTVWEPETTCDQFDVKLISM